MEDRKQSSFKYKHIIKTSIKEIKQTSKICSQVSKLLLAVLW